MTKTAKTSAERQRTPSSPLCRPLLVSLALLQALFVCINTSLADAKPLSLYGVNYSLRIGPDWTYGADRCKSRSQIQKELKQLKPITNRIRVYTMTDCNTGPLLMELTAEVGMEVWLGIWVGPDKTVFPEERNVLLQLLEDNKSFQNVIGIHVSSEAIYREDITVMDALELRKIIADDLAKFNYPNIPVTISDIIDTNLLAPALTTNADPNVVTFNQFPFWERTTDINNAAQYMANRVNFVENVAAGRQIIVTETGWADAGSNKDANIASPASMAKWLRDFVCLAEYRNWGYFWFVAYDSDWRRINEQLPDDVEGHFGLFEADGTIKPHIANLDIDCSQPQINIDPNNPLPPPTKAPVKQPTNAPVKQPTNAPVKQPTNAPIKTTTIIIPDDTQYPNPTKTPTTYPSVVPDYTMDPIPTKAPTKTTTTKTTTNTNINISNNNNNNNGSSSQCSQNEFCGIELTGECCPTTDGVYLACCSGITTANVVEESCSQNQDCADLGLEGACCPAIPINDDMRKNGNDDFYLDCCNYVPDECIDNSNCQVYSAREYINAQQQQATSSAEMPKQIFTTFFVVASCLLLLLVV